MTEFDFTAFFTSCGSESVINISYGIEFVDKERMYEAISGSKWKNIKTEEFNNLFAWYKSTGVMLDWNRTVTKIKKEEIPDIDISLKETIKILFEKETKPVYDALHYDILMILMNCKIKSLQSHETNQSPAFYNELLKIYQSGHLPCGWRGKYPRGNMLVF